MPVPLIKVRKFVDMHIHRSYEVGSLCDLHILFIGKEKSKKVVVLGGRIVGASSAMLVMASCASLAF